MIQNLRILSTGPDLAEQQRRAMTSPCVAQLLQIRLSHFEKGHDQESDDATSYPRMIDHFGRNIIQTLLDRSHGNASPEELIGAATAALKGAAQLLAIADKAHRHAARLRAELAAAEQEN